MPDPAAPAVQPCGTKAAYQRHLKHDETPCEPCTAANNGHRRQHFPGTRERNRLYQQALRNANKRLQELQPDSWRALLAEEMQRLEGLQ